MTSTTWRNLLSWLLGLKLSVAYKWIIIAIALLLYTVTNSNCWWYLIIDNIRYRLIDSGSLVLAKRFWMGLIFTFNKLLHIKIDHRAPIPALIFQTSILGCGGGIRQWVSVWITEILLWCLCFMMNWLHNRAFKSLIRWLGVQWLLVQAWGWRV